MCLRINKKVRNNHHKEDGYCVAYKVIFHDNSTLFARCDEFLYTIGENVPLESLEQECMTMKVYFGLHLFLDKCIAKKLVSRHNNTKPKNAKMIKVYYKPEDVIAYGKSNTFTRFSVGDDGGEKSVVVRKLTIKSLDPIE